jgi:hypothetical protein
MILSEQQLKDIILKNPNKALVNAGQEYNKKLRMHFYGERLAGELLTVDGFEKESLRNLRVKYARSNKDLMHRVGRPMDKVFSARGTSIYYNLDEARDKRARALSSDVRSGYSIRKWIENFWKPHYRDDPNGMIFMEIAHNPAPFKARGQSYVYPTYKGIGCVYDYLPNGANLEYVAFNVDKNEKVAESLDPDWIVYRVVDDSMDYYVRRVDDDNIRVLADHSFPNLFNYVPAILNSDIPNPNVDRAMLSVFDEVLELATQFLIKGSIKVTHDFMHGFPKYWEYADDCPKCGGTKFDGGEPCKDCKGTGKKTMSKVSDIKLLAYPQTKEDPLVTPNVAGYVEPSKTYYEIATADLQMLEDLMNYTMWGAMAAPRPTGPALDQSKGVPTKTATEIVSEIKPQSDRLEPISETAEKRHKFILDAVIRIQIDQNYPGASVNYGKRYMIESPDEIWMKYSEARIKGAATSVLDDLLLEYYEAKYNSDPVKLSIQSKLMKVEPFVHLTALQVGPLLLTDLDFYRKVYFSEWLATLNDSMILSFSTELLDVQLTDFAKKKLVDKPAPEVTPAKKAA